VWPGIDLQRCGGCRTEFLHPQPSDERLTEIYGPSYYEPWHHETADNVRIAKEKTFAPILAAAELTRGQRLLDVGCATGQFAGLAVREGLDVFGVDLNPDAIATARASVPTASFHAGTMADDPFPGQQFDAVVMVDFIEHVRSPEHELETIARRLAPDGKLVISTPRIDSGTRRLTGRFWPQYREEHLTYFSESGLQAVLQRIGFTISRITPTKKMLTPAYLYGQAVAYPIPVATPLIKLAWPVLPIPRHRPFGLRLGEMTVVASRR
jgi:2-polyprenyl-3-methyl-5-hydroxy-6-metoxy-1,4-benzoquinol methylase